MCTAQDLGLGSQCFNHVMGARRRLNWIVGGRLHTPTFHQLPYLKDFHLLGLKNKQPQSLPLKEDFRQFARPGNSRVSRLHEVRKLYLNASCLSKAKQKFTRNWATKSTWKQSNTVSTQTYQNKQQVLISQTIQTNAQQRQAMSSSPNFTTYKTKLC